MELKEKIEEIESSDELSGVYLLYALLDLATKVTGRGYISDDYTKTIEFDIGDIHIIIDEYYSKLTIEINECEYEINERDPIIDILIKEIKKRILDFDKKTRKIKEKISEEVFDKSLSKEIMQKIIGDEEFMNEEDGELK